MRRALTLSLALALAASAAPATAQPVDPKTYLLSQARLWESRYRNDLARQAIDKLLAMDPRNADGLGALALLELNGGHRQEAEAALERLKAVAPNHPDVRRVEEMLRVTGPDRAKMAQARILAKAGRTDSAIAAFDALFPKGPPTGDLALEYWGLVANTPKGWQPALDGLHKLVRDFPDNQRYRLALAAHLAIKFPTRPDVLNTFRELAKDHQLRREAMSAWRRAVGRIDENAAAIPYYREYLQEDPNDTTIRRLMEALIAAQEEHRRLMANPYYQAGQAGLAALDAGKLDLAEAKFAESLQGRPKDPEILGGMGLVRLRQGRHQEAQAYFEQALKLDPDNRSKWLSLLRTADFWGLMRAASEAEDAGKLELAREKLDEALRTEPKSPDALAALAGLDFRQGQTEKAEERYRQALAIDPLHASALGGLVNLYLKTDQPKKAEALVAGLDGKQKAAAQAILRDYRARVLRHDAEMLQAAGRQAEALPLLEEALVLDPDNAWLRFDLADLMARQGEVARAQALFEDRLQEKQGTPPPPELLYAYALFQSRQDDDSAALRTLERIPTAERSEGMASLQRRLWVAVQIRRAELTRLSGATEKGRAILEEAQKGAGSDPDLTASVASAWLDFGDEDRALALMRGVVGSDPTPAMQLRLARLLYRTHGEKASTDPERLLQVAHRDAALADLLSREITASGLSAAERVELTELQEAVAIRTADELRRQGDLAGAMAAIAPVLSEHPDSSRLLMERARIHRDGADYPAALADYRRILEANANDLDAALAMVDTLISAGDHPQALARIDSLLPRVSPPAQPDIDSWVRLVRQLLRLGDYARAGAEIGKLRAAAPDNSRVLVAAGLWEKHAGQYDRAIADFRRAAEGFSRPAATLALVGHAAQSTEEEAQEPGSGAASSPPPSPTPPGASPSATPPQLAVLPPTDGTTVDAFQNIALLEDERRAQITAAIDLTGRNATEGKSSVSQVGLPVEIRWPWRDGRLFARIEPIRTDAGQLDTTDTYEVKTFGTLLLCQPDCPRLPGASRASGTALGAGFENDRWRFDIGTTPIGFPVQNVVGGVRYDGDLGETGYRLDVSRRPVTSTLLSYAGMEDPLSGRTWGGVVATGARLSLSYDKGGPYGLWASLGLHSLTGKNVADNTAARFMGGGYWRVISETNRELSVGLNMMKWHYAENLGEFTFGHGGYFSPQSYFSIALPVAWYHRTVRLSYLLRGSISQSWSDTKDMPYYPTDPSLQAAAQALQPLTFTDPIYTGGPGGGFGYSLAGAFEYQVSPSLYLGGHLSFERSQDYEPNKGMLYLRYDLSPSASPLKMPPQPLIPYSLF